MMSSNTQEGWDTNGSITTYTKYVRTTSWHRLDINGYYITIIHLDQVHVNKFSSNKN